MFVKQEHSRLLRELKAHSRDQGRFNIAHYLGTSDEVYNVPVPKLKKIAEAWAKGHADISRNDTISILDTLFFGASREEKVLASLILGRFPVHLVALDGKRLDRWLGQLEGWEEVDAMCDEIDVWFRYDPKRRISLLKAWNSHEHVEKRRASLVILCSTVRRVESTFLRDTSFQFIDSLTSEKNVMITKAISWLLRAMLKYYKSDVSQYLKKNLSSLPNVAVREVTRKLETGRK